MRAVARAVESAVVRAGVSAVESAVGALRRVAGLRVADGRDAGEEGEAEEEGVAVSRVPLASCVASLHGPGEAPTAAAGASPAPWNRPSAGAACVAFASSTEAAPEKRPSWAAAGAALGAVVGAAV